MSIVTIIIGLTIWLVVSILVNNAVKKKTHKKAISMLCCIIGITIIVFAFINYLLSIF